MKKRPAERRAVVARTWGGLRWLLLVPAVGAAFVCVGMTVALPCLMFGFDPGLLLAGPLSAIVWVVTAYSVAPSHKARVAGVAYMAGVIVAWFLCSSGMIQGRGWHMTFTVSCVAGMGALLFCFLWKAPRRGLGFAAHALSMRSISDSMTHAGQYLTRKGKQAMQDKQTIRDLIRHHTWVRVLVIAAVIMAGGHALTMLGRGVVDIVPQDRRGLYMRLGRYVRTVEPGLHLKIPLVDSIIGVPVKERQGYIKHVDAMTEDNVIMKVSLQYTYEVTDPRQYRLEVQGPETIIKEFVQGKLRDIVNTITMSDVMKKRMELGQRVREGISAKEGDYGIHFKLIQVQGAFPPIEVQDAIKQRMVTEQRTGAAREQATQQKILADATLYEAQRQSEAAGYQIREVAMARKESIRIALEELSKHEALGNKYIEYLMAQELKENSKWIISGHQAPQIHMGVGKEVSGLAMQQDPAQ